MTEKLKLLEELDIIEIDNGPTSWINPLVALEKPNGDIRICLDMRQANRAILREKHPVPTVEETLQEISKAKVLSKLNLNMAFHQIEPHPNSRQVTTSAAPDVSIQEAILRRQYGNREVSAVDMANTKGSSRCLQPA